MTAKGRGRRGERNGAARLTAEDVRYIRANYTPHRGGRRQAVRAELAARFGVSGEQIHRIVTRQWWDWLPD
jgi:hypothetical protein